MSIQSEITRISGNVSDSFSEIEAKGVTVPSDANSDDLPELIRAIDTNVQADWAEDDSTDPAYILNKPTIPNNSNWVNGSATGSVRTVGSAAEDSNYTINLYSVAEGYNTKSSGGAGSHAEGQSTIASGGASHAEGYETTASAFYSHSEGQKTTASGSRSHAEGWSTTAGGSASHAEGKGTIALSTNQHVQGQYNIEDSAGVYADIVGNGEGSSNRSNAYTLDWSGNGVYAGKLTVGAGPSNNMDVATKQYVDNAIPAAPSLASLTDTTITTPDGDQILTYDSITSKWINKHHFDPPWFGGHWESITITANNHDAWVMMPALNARASHVKLSYTIGENGETTYYVTLFADPYSRGGSSPNYYSFQYEGYNDNNEYVCFSYNYHDSAWNCNITNLYATSAEMYVPGNEVMVVSVTYTEANNQTVYSADKTYAEIIAAINTGTEVVCYCESNGQGVAFLPLVNIDDGIEFANCQIGSGVYNSTDPYSTVYGLDVWISEEDEVDCHYKNAQISTPASSAPLVDGASAVVGTSITYARADHVHPVSSLSALSDTTISSPSNGQVLTYNTTNSKWQNSTLTTPDEVMIFNVTYNNATEELQADKTYVQILAAINAGTVVICHISDMDYYEVDSYLNFNYYNAEELYISFNFTYIDGYSSPNTPGFFGVVLEIFSDESIVCRTSDGIIRQVTSTVTPSQDGVAFVGISNETARADHVHPKITQTISMSSNVITLTGSDGTTSSVTLPVYSGTVVSGGGS